MVNRIFFNKKRSPTKTITSLGFVRDVLFFFFRWRKGEMGRFPSTVKKDLNQLSKDQETPKQTQVNLPDPRKPASVANTLRLPKTWVSSWSKGKQDILFDWQWERCIPKNLHSKVIKKEKKTKSDVFFDLKDWKRQTWHIPIFRSHSDTLDWFRHRTCGVYQHASCIVRCEV